MGGSNAGYVLLVFYLASTTTDIDLEHPVYFVPPPLILLIYEPTSTLNPIYNNTHVQHTPLTNP